MTHLTIQQSGILWKVTNIWEIERGKTGSYLENYIRVLLGYRIYPSGGLKWQKGSRILPTAEDKLLKALAGFK